MPTQLKVISLGLRMFAGTIAKLKDRPILQRAIGNAGWLLGDRIVRLGIGFIVSVWVARYLGPDQFGLWSYAIAIVSMFGVLATLGLDNVVIRDLVRQPNQSSETLGTASALRLFGSLIGIVFIGVVVAMFEDVASTQAVLIYIVATGLLMRPADVIDLRFQADTRSRPMVIARFVVFVLSSLAKIVLVLVQARVLAFAITDLMAVILSAIFLVAVHRWSGYSFQGWRWSTSRARELISVSWPLILSGLTVMFYMRIDQVMLKEMAGADAVGVYSAAVRLSEVWYFIPAAIVASVFPTIVKLRSSSEEIYYRRLQQLFDIVAAIAIAIAVPMTFISMPLMNILYGERYHGAGMVLAIHIWTALFIFWGVAQEPWNLSEGFTRLTFYRTLIGAFINIVLNLVFIPRWGPVGAALATLISQASVAFLSNALYHPTRRIFFMQLRSLEVWRLAG